MLAVMELKDVRQLDIPELPGCYKYINQEEVIIYVGKAVNLKSRVLSYWQKSANLTPAKQQMLTEIERIEWVTVDSEIEAFLLEANLIKKYQPRYNIAARDDKRHLYIKISTEDDIPGVYMTRQIDRSGKYFGPFTSTEAVRETLKVIRKIWPYCNMKTLQKKPCFHSQIGRCLGVCDGRISFEEYKRKVIRPLIMFLEGRKGEIVKKLEVRKKKLEKELKNRQTAFFRVKIKSNNLPTPTPPEGNNAESKVPSGGDLGVGNMGIKQACLSKVEMAERTSEEIEKELWEIKYQLLNMRNVLEHSRIVSVAEKYANDVVELAKLLNLPKIPLRIEGYDISNIFGKEAVGSMVVFYNGEPDKNEYRKFKIKNEDNRFNYVAKGGDIKMLEEVLSRRFRHVEMLAPQNPPRAGVPAHPSQEGTNAGIYLSQIAGTSQGKRLKPDSWGSGEGKLKYISNSMKEAMRLNEKKSEGVENKAWALPDLVIIDGGKAQLNVALRVLKKYRLDIPVIGISKGEGLRSAIAPDKLFFAGAKTPLELPLASPALHLIKRVRDEAHRFAIGYHRLLRGKKFLKKNDF